MTKARDNDSLRGSAGSSSLLAPIAMTILLAGCQTVSNVPEPVSAEQDGLRKTEKNLEDTLENTKESSLKVAEKETGKKTDVVVPKRPDDLWVRMQQGLGMNLDQDHARIQAELNWYIRNKSYFSRISSRAEPYLYFIIKEAENPSGSTGTGTDASG